MRLPAVFVVLILTADLPADKPKKPNPWTIDDILQAEYASDFRISPDGKYAIWVKSMMDEQKDQAIANLMRTDLRSRKTIPLTRGKDFCSQPRWSPDGKWVAFLSDRVLPETTDRQRAKKRRSRNADRESRQVQIWLLDPTGGEPYPLTDGKRSINDFAWSDDETIVFAAQEEPTLYETTTEKEKKDTSVVVDDEAHEPPVRLFTVDVESKLVTRLTTNKDRIRQLAVSPDGTYAATIRERSLTYVYDSKIKPIVVLTDLATGEETPIFVEPKFRIDHLAWSPDGKSLYAVNAVGSTPDFAHSGVWVVYSFDPQTKKAAEVPLDWERGLAAAGGVVPTETGFLALLADGARNKLAHYRKSADGKWSKKLLTGEHTPHIFGVSNILKDGTLIYEYSTASTPTKYFLAKLAEKNLAEPKEIVSLNRDFDEKTIAKTELIRWAGANGEEVEGLLYYPHDWKAGTKAPLVVLIHGGPAAADFDQWDESWASATQLLCQRGAFVFKPNYHGSSNYGLKFLESIAAGKYYDLEIPDIEKGVDSLLQRGLVDPNRLGVGGWSNGAILTIALTVSTTRYKAAVAGAGDVEWASDWGNCEFGASFNNYYLGKSPLQDPQLYLRKSPFYRLDKVRTPTLIFFGTEDRAVPTQQGWMHYRALQQLKNTDVRFLLFPGEGHSPARYVHQKRKLDEELAWFDKYLFAKTSVSNEALKPDSPLAKLLTLNRAAKVGKSYGVLVNGTFAPEVVAYQGMQIGRFEVTRAQWREFAPQTDVPPGTENLPIGQVTFEQAQAYCEWLSKKTGFTYRLPTAEEADELYPDQEADANTLDYWAGYALNPDDAARLAPTLKELRGEGALLRPVGSFAWAGKEDDAKVFDLGGNVAEWTIDEDESGVLRGGSADRPADPKAPASDASPAYRGLRVVRVEKPGPTPKPK